MRETRKKGQDICSHLAGYNERFVCINFINKRLSLFTVLWAAAWLVAYHNDLRYEALRGLLIADAQLMMDDNIRALW